MADGNGRRWNARKGTDLFEWQGATPPPGRGASMSTA
jgi:hypothetical protein